MANKQDNTKLEEKNTCDFCGKECSPEKYFCCEACEIEQFNYDHQLVH